MTRARMGKVDRESTIRLIRSVCLKYPAPSHGFPPGRPRRQVLRQAGNAGHRVADLVGDPAARQPMEARRSLCSSSSSSSSKSVMSSTQDTGVGAAAGVVGHRLGFMRADPAGSRVYGHLGLEHGVIVAPVERVQHVAPEVPAGIPAANPGPVAGDPGNFLHTAIPDRHLAVEADRAPMGSLSRVSR